MVPPPAPAATAPPVDPIPAAADPTRYDGAWLVLVQASRETGVLPDSWPILFGIEMSGVRPERLNTGHYKGLMPCYEIRAGLLGNVPREYPLRPEGWSLWVDRWVF